MVILDVPIPVAAPATAVIKAPPLMLTGMLRSSTTLYPLQGMLVKFFYLEPSSTPDIAPPPRLLGSAISDATGNFTLGWDPNRAVTQLLCLLISCSDAQYIITVSTGAEQAPLLTTEPTSVNRSELSLDLQVPIPVHQLSPSRWKDFGTRVGAARISTLNEVINQLVHVPVTQSIFSEWPVDRRHNAVAQLESAFLDPHGILNAISPLPAWQVLEEPGGLDSYRKMLGNQINHPNVQAALIEAEQKLAAFPSLSSVDWQIDPKQFSHNPAKAITAHQADYYGSYFPNPALDIKNKPAGFVPELGYRDYLRNRWTGQVVQETNKQIFTVTQAEQQLRNRFHQDFTTFDITTKPVNEILIPIMIDILTTPPGKTFGFGIQLISIPPRRGTPARQYLDTLIDLTGLSANELTLRYRTDFTRPDTLQSSEVWENIYTLQGFFRDSFQSVTDPEHVDPDVFNSTIIPGPVQINQFIQLQELQGTAPYFLEYDEWLLLQNPIPFENYVQIRTIFQMDLGEYARHKFTQNAGDKQSLYKEKASFVLGALKIYDKFKLACQKLDQRDYHGAIDTLNEIILFKGHGPGFGDPMVRPLLYYYHSVIDSIDVEERFRKRRAIKITSFDELNKMLTQWQVGDYDDRNEPHPAYVDGTTLESDYLDGVIPDLVCSVVYLGLFILPTLRAQALLALGDYAGAIRLLGRAAGLQVGIASENQSAWLASTSEPLHFAGNLPYTVNTRPTISYPDLTYNEDLSWNTDIANIPLEQRGLYIFIKIGLVPNGLHAVERAFYKLLMGEAMLGWADKLYQTNQASNISRARELYKGVYFLHGTVPPINPDWSNTDGRHVKEKQRSPIDLSQTQRGFFPQHINPAKVSQLARAELGFTQIEAGLNYLGYTDDMVPSLRYSTLKPAADAFAADAVSAERDFLNAMTQIETATVEAMKNNAMLQRANLQVRVAQQQTAIAKDQVIQAQITVSQVNQQIQAVQQQIADHDSFFGQLGDFIGGIANIVKGLPSFFTSGVGSGVGEELGVSSAETNGLLGLGAGASTLAGFGAFYVASYMTLSSMADSQNQRHSQLDNLQNQNLPFAKAQLDIAQRSVTIATLQQYIAEADADLATSLLVFAQDRYLSVEFWSYMAKLFQRTMRQYLDLATRTGWLAQRALAYEHNVSVNIIGFDYYPEQYQGAGGADQLQLDLTNLQARYIAGLQEMVPIKFTISLARDFPLQFAQLLTRGNCLFKTNEQTLQLAYPGVYGSRIIATTLRLVRTAGSAPIRGLLVNGGISKISNSNGNLVPSIRPSDALPFSEFDVDTTDMQVFGLPGASLMQFEGSGMETIWEIIFPTAANPTGLTDLADVLITFNIRAHFSPILLQTQRTRLPGSFSKLILISAYRRKIGGLSDLRGQSAKANLVFDIPTLGLPIQEKTRTLNNLILVLVGLPVKTTVQAQIISTNPSKTIDITLSDGMAFSNSPPITDPQSSVPLSPLNALTGTNANQALTLHINKNANTGVDFTRISDVLLGIDYTATF